LLQFIQKGWQARSYNNLKISSDKLWTSHSIVEGKSILVGLCLHEIANVNKLEPISTNFKAAKNT